MPGRPASTQETQHFLGSTCLAQARMLSASHMFLGLLPPSLSILYKSTWKGTPALKEAELRKAMLLKPSLWTQGFDRSKPKGQLQKIKTCWCLKSVCSLDQPMGF